MEHNLSSSRRSIVRKIEDLMRNSQDIVNRFLLASDGPWRCAIAPSRQGSDRRLFYEVLKATLALPSGRSPEVVCAMRRHAPGQPFREKWCRSRQRVL